MDDVTLLSWLTSGKYLFGLLAVIATVGSFVCSLNSDRITKRVERVKQEESVKRERAKNAEAARLAAEVKKANDDVAGAKSEASEAKTKADGFQFDIQRANERAASAHEVAERERAARFQLEARIADRSLTGEQQAHFIGELSRFPGTFADVVINDKVDEEALSVALPKVLRAAHWKVHLALDEGSSVRVRGIEVGTQAGSELSISKAAETLIGLLRSMGIGINLVPFDRLKPLNIAFGMSRVFGISNVQFDAPMRVWIGSKPKGSDPN